MFVILVTYKKPIDVVETHVPAHRAFLDEGYKAGHFIVAGPRVPRTGGVILSQLKDREQLQKIIEQDPFYDLGVADFEVIEFTPTKYHQDFVNFI
jgi:uncharacterized protein YciI